MEKIEKPEVAPPHMRSEGHKALDGSEIWWEKH